eukprot:8210949-Heterocapsa_arctica.AAC.1
MTIALPQFRKDDPPTTSFASNDTKALQHCIGNSNPKRLLQPAMKHSLVSHNSLLQNTMSSGTGINTFCS